MFLTILCLLVKMGLPALQGWSHHTVSRRVGMCDSSRRKILPRYVSCWRILKIRMSKVIKQQITKNSIQEKFYNIPTIKNQIALRQLTYLGKIFRREESHIPTRLLTVWCDHPCKAGRPILTNRQSMVRNIQQVILNVDAYGSMSTWVFHALDAQHWNDLLNTL